MYSRLKNADAPLSYEDFSFTNQIPLRTDIERELACTPAEKIKLRSGLYDIQEGKCNLCHTEFEPRHLEMDHIVPKAKGGQDWVENFQLLCASCNRISGTGSQEDARARLQKKRGIDLSVFK